eukprot:CAMPEP_0195295488 /NCGR_PEP_ID=MMETSP0707-20130614/17509_1 /TAXON_ID=33640 /ORGANISM="Asterionellopsis glacialis, Strain CCMP134" /LENGTH=74 /DNA_ID=CAMNT_0040356729 /DNA_START=102 /DNA_END=323 /DNA_ORIENTATION=+
MPISPSQVPPHHPNYHQNNQHHAGAPFTQGAHSGQPMAPPSPMHHHHSAPAQTNLFPQPPQAPEPMDEDDRDAP